MECQRRSNCSSCEINIDHRAINKDLVHAARASDLARIMQRHLDNMNAVNVATAVHCMARLDKIAMDLRRGARAAAISACVA